MEFEKGNIKREHGIQPELFIKRIHLILPSLKKKAFTPTALKDSGTHSNVTFVFFPEILKSKPMCTKVK